MMVHECINHRPVPPSIKQCRVETTLVMRISTATHHVRHSSASVAEEITLQLSMNEVLKILPTMRLGIALYIHLVRVLRS